MYVVQWQRRAATAAAAGWVGGLLMSTAFVLFIHSQQHDNAQRRANRQVPTSRFRYDYLKVQVRWNQVQMQINWEWLREESR